VEGILSPPDTVVSGTNYPVRATVKNFGDADVENSFNVNCLITPGPWGGNYSVPDTFYAGEVDTALFGIWQAGAASFYIICVETQLTDSIPANDQMCETLYVARSDASVDTILSPPDVVNMGAIYPVEAFVENFGNVRQTIEVRCWDMGIYNEIETCTLDQGMSTTLSFNNWTAPGIPISWWMSCSTRVSGDVDVTNDKFTKNIIVTGIEESPGEPSTPKFFSLSQNSPNPVTHSTTISYAIPGIRGSGDQAISGGGKLPVQLSIYDITGCLVKTLVDGEQEPGYYSVIWDGRREDGREVSSGIYFYRLQISQGDFTATRKLILLR